LRGKLYDRFAGNRWSRTSALPQRIELVDGTWMRSSALSAGTGVEQTITLARELAPTLLHAPAVQSLRFPGSDLLGYQDGVFVAVEPLRADTSYSIAARLTLREGRYLLREAPGNLALYLQADGTSARLRQLAQSLTANVPGTRAKALALEEHLRTQYRYSYETVALQNYTPLDWFLFESRRGHCEFFASALAMLLRSVGIPARIATGFSLHDPNPLTGFYEVRRLDGHAWVEAYVAGEGWLMLEPTPFYPLPQPAPERQIAEVMDGYLERLASTRELLEPGTLATRMTVLMRDTWRGIRIGLRALTHPIRVLGWGLPFVLLAGVAGLLALYLLALAAVDSVHNLQVRRSLERLPMHDTRATTLRLTEMLLRVTAPRRFARRQDWTLREYAQRLREGTERGKSLTIPETFIDAFDAARYAGANHEVHEPMTPVITLIRERIHNHPWPRLMAALERLRRVWPKPRQRWN
jgi:transglutaminase-like putative cysteine protease